MSSPLFPQEIIRRKRDGERLSEAEIEHMVRGLTDGTIGDGQIAAFAMAVFFRGMEAAERVALTRAMTASGTTIDWGGVDLGGPRLDKHSTGGVGDTVSLMLAPLVAACGGSVPMISGRSLGHTGGTLDKLESIPGYDATPSLARFQRVVAEVGCGIIGQTSDLAPADRRLYALRDVTATVESIPLITASILSKKLAAGLQGLVMDVKFGNGAFAADLAMARELATSIASVGSGAGLPTVALLTDMSQVLGHNAGNALELHETIDYLTGRLREPRLHQVVLTLGCEMLRLGGLADSDAAADEALNRALDSGAAAERFQRMVAALGGPHDLLERSARHLGAAPVRHAVAAGRSGFVAAVDTRALGLVIMGLGGGRRRPDDRIDHRVGLATALGPGEEVTPDRPLAIVHAASDSDAERAAVAIRAAIVIAEEPPAARPVILERIGG